MKKTVLILLLAMTFILLPACSAAKPAFILGQEIKSDKPRITAPEVTQSDLSTLVNGNNTFAFNLFQVLSSQDGNLFYSPYSISEALAMTYAGARGTTETDMANALKFPLAQSSLHPAFNDLDLQLKQRGEGAKGTDEKGFRLNVVNAIWGQSGFNFLNSYLDVLAQNYGAGLRVVDFIKQTEQSRTTINDWVSEQTEGKIKDLIPPGSINEMTRLVLTNAIYFNAAWAKQFQKDATSDGTFHTLNSGDVTVPVMHQTESLKYTEGTNYQAIEIPYDGNQLSMVVLLPAEGQYTNFEQSLNAGLVDNILNNMKSENIVLSLPKFQYDAELGLKSALSQLGMSVAFTDNADFSGINGKKDLSIQDVLHKAYISVDENGTEAAAASAIMVGTTAMPAQQYTFNVDRPFIFFIRDIPTGQVIFIGRVLNPA